MSRLNQPSQWMRSIRQIAIANTLRYHRFFGRYLSNAALVDLRVAAVPFNIDLGLDRRSVSTDLLENVTIICLPKVLGAAASCLERGEFRPQLQRRVDTAGPSVGQLANRWFAADHSPCRRFQVSA